ncbi:FAD/NAD-binding ferredoxin reductase-type domain-containing protein (plasmid) [Rhizobium etli 8C-3]|uniref:FAD/NAD-binding ferredoxin reductase-type domain-containing protein n=2 Tax=Rhizobium etli TaxID=29449 RepID=A0A1L5PAR2_RHIET|nr:FAD/NAD-binding ferredoxin reductase-type domain-containing protein [Rhizobium etli 8C-3]
MISMFHWLVDTGLDADVVFITNVRTPDDIISRQELLHISARLSSKLKLAIVPAAASPARPWHGPTGKLYEMLVRTFARDFNERETVCGLPGYTAVAKALLADMGSPWRNITMKALAAHRRLRPHPQQPKVHRQLSRRHHLWP